MPKSPAKIEPDKRAIELARAEAIYLVNFRSDLPLIERLPLEIRHLDVPEQPTGYLHEEAQRPLPVQVLQPLLRCVHGQYHQGDGVYREGEERVRRVRLG